MSLILWNKNVKVLFINLNEILVLLALPNEQS